MSQPFKSFEEIKRTVDQMDLLKEIFDAVFMYDPHRDMKFPYDFPMTQADPSIYSMILVDKDDVAKNGYRSYELLIKKQYIILMLLKAGLKLNEVSRLTHYSNSMKDFNFETGRKNDNSATTVTYRTPEGSRTVSLSSYLETERIGALIDMRDYSTFSLMVWNEYVTDVKYAERLAINTTALEIYLMHYIDKVHDPKYKLLLNEITKIARKHDLTDTIEMINMYTNTPTRSIRDDTNTPTRTIRDDDMKIALNPTDPENAKILYVSGIEYRNALREKLLKQPIAATISFDSAVRYMDDDNIFNVANEIANDPTNISSITYLRVIDEKQAETIIEVIDQLRGARPTKMVKYIYSILHALPNPVSSKPEDKRLYEEIKSAVDRHNRAGTSQTQDDDETPVPEKPRVVHNNRFIKKPSTRNDVVVVELQKQDDGDDDEPPRSKPPVIRNVRGPMRHPHENNAERLNQYVRNTQGASVTRRPNSRSPVNDRQYNGAPPADDGRNHNSAPPADDGRNRRPISPDVHGNRPPPSFPTGGAAFARALTPQEIMRLRPKK